MYGDCKFKEPSLLERINIKDDSEHLSMQVLNTGLFNTENFLGWVCMPSMVIFCTQFFPRSLVRVDCGVRLMTSATWGLWLVRTCPARVLEVMTPE